MLYFSYDAKGPSVLWSRFYLLGLELASAPRVVFVVQQETISVCFLLQLEKQGDWFLKHAVVRFIYVHGTLSVYLMQRSKHTYFTTFQK